jgi:hypothetical protein
MSFDVDPRTGVRRGQVIRIHSQCRALRKYAREIERIAQGGDTGEGATYTPVAAESWEQLKGPLAGLSETAHALEARVGGVPARRVVHSFEATRAAISGRLAHVEELIADLEPERIERSYGALPADAAVELREAVAALRGQLKDLRAALGGAAPAGGEA